MVGYDIFVFILIIVIMVTISMLYVFIAIAIKRSAMKSNKQTTDISPSSYVNSEVNQSNMREITTETNDCLPKSPVHNKSKESVNYSSRNSSEASNGKVKSVTESLRNKYQTSRFSYMFISVVFITYVPSNAY